MVKWLPPDTVVSLVAHNQEFAGSIPAGSSNTFLTKTKQLSCWLNVTKSRGPLKEGNFFY
jgi:hypothetical protein